jgi:hypothetical protein
VVKRVLTVAHSESSCQCRENFGINAARQQPTLTRRDTALAPLIYSELGAVDCPARLSSHAEAERIASDLPVASRTLLPLRATDGRARLSFVAELIRSTVIWDDQYFPEGAPSEAPRLGPSPRPFGTAYPAAGQFLRPCRPGDRSPRKRQHNRVGRSKDRAELRSSVKVSFGGWLPW